MYQEARNASEWYKRIATRMLLKRCQQAMAVRTGNDNSMVP